MRLRRRHQLADGVLRPRRLALGKRRHRAVAGVFEAGFLRVPGGELGAHVLVANGRLAIDLHLLCQLENLPKAHAAATAANGHALVHQRGEGHLPTLADGTETLIVRYAHVGEVHLVEVGTA